MKNIIITGANGNLGSAVVKKFLDEKYNVTAVDNADNHLAFAKGNSDFQFKTIQSNKKIDGGLLLVGGFAMGSIDKTTGADIDKMFSLNFKTAFFLARPLFQHMVANGYGRLVFVGARPALKAEQGKSMVAYALSKSLLFKLAEFLNAEAKNKNIVSSVIVPSTIDTPQNRQSMPETNPDNWVKAEQIAEVLEFICSGKNDPVREAVYKLYNNS
jgi:NAD(P)-dependent dehydrogenase (short-subunit alcohol dehydrogenase family)